MIDGNHETATIFHLYGNDFTLLHDAMPRPFKGLLHFRRNGIGNMLQHVLIKGIAALGRHTNGRRLAVRRFIRGQIDHLPVVCLGGFHMRRTGQMRRTAGPVSASNPCPSPGPAGNWPRWTTTSRHADASFAAAQLVLTQRFWSVRLPSPPVGQSGPTPLSSTGPPERQGTATPPARLVLQMQEQLVAGGLAQFPVDQQINLVLWICRLDVLVNTAHYLTSITSNLANSARNRNRARCKRASIALSVMPRRAANWR